MRQITDDLAKSDPNPVLEALDQSGVVHFARFVFLNDRQLAIITTFDGTFQSYGDVFVNLLGDMFNQLLAHAEDAPPLPVHEHRREFSQYVATHNLLPAIPFYSAYPTLTVLDIQALSEK